MENRNEQNSERLFEINRSLRKGLGNINLGNNWLEMYEQWRNEDANRFDGLLTITDSFNLQVAGDASTVDFEDENCQTFFDNISISAFFSKSLLNHARETVETVCKARNPERKKQAIKAYFDFIEQCKEDHDLAPAVVILHDCAEQQTVLHAKHVIDLHISCISMLEIYNTYSVESIYLRYTYWRLTQGKEDLEHLVTAISKYVKAYFYEYDNDPDFRLNYPMDSLTIISKLAIIMHWFKLITFHTKGLIKVYKKKGWLLPIDQLVDDYSIINQISKYEMLKYKIVFESDDNNTVKQKAICNHSYGVWIKTTDIVVITYDIARIIYGYSDESVKKLSTSRAALLELYDNMLKIRDVYTGIIFAHRAFYVDKRQDHNSQVLEAQERDAQRIIESIDDMLQITGGFLSDNIDDLLLAKQEYKNRLSIFMSEDQERKLDDYMVKVANKIKENVSKLSIYDRLYEATTDEFKKYAQNLLKFQNIFSSLVSAEYLYHQYVENKEPINKFDYSCISIMYYMALEDFVNKLIYTSYAEEILDPNDDLVKNDYKRYVSHRFKFYDKDNSCFKKSCEIGNLGHLLYNLSRETAFTDYLRNRYVGIDLKKMIEYGNKLINVAQRRNDAAHGGNLLSYDDVRYDKKKVYSNATDEYRGLILELFKLLFGA